MHVKRTETDLYVYNIYNNIVRRIWALHDGKMKWGE